MIQLEVYIDNGVVYQYEVESVERAREHADAIVRDGYYHSDGKSVFVAYPSHRILKVQCSAVVSTKYPSTVSGT